MKIVSALVIAALSVTASSPALAQQKIDVGPGNWLYLQETDRNTGLESFNLLKDDFTVSCGVKFNPKIALRIPMSAAPASTLTINYTAGSESEIVLGTIQTDALGAIRLNDGVPLRNILNSLKLGQVMQFRGEQGGSTVTYELDATGGSEAIGWLEKNCQL